MRHGLSKLIKIYGNGFQTNWMMLADLLLNFYYKSSALIQWLYKA